MWPQLRVQVEVLLKFFRACDTSLGSARSTENARGVRRDVWRGRVGRVLGMFLQRASWEKSAEKGDIIGKTMGFL